MLKINKESFDNIFTLSLTNSDIYENSLSELEFELIINRFSFDSSFIPEPTDGTILNKKVVFVSRFYTNKKFRGKKYGDFLFNYFLNDYCKKLKSKNFKQIVLEAQPFDTKNNEENKEKLINFYKRNGFKIFETTNKHEVWMYKNI